MKEGATATQVVLGILTSFPVIIHNFFEWFPRERAGLDKKRPQKIDYPRMTGDFAGQWACHLHTAQKEVIYLSAMERGYTTRTKEYTVEKVTVYRMQIPPNQSWSVSPQHNCSGGHSVWKNMIILFQTKCHQSN